MILSKLLFAGFAVACMLYFLVLTRKTALTRLFVVLFFGSATVLIIWPGLTSRCANFIGIGRGADLIFYLTTLFLTSVCFNFYLRFRAIEATQTRIVRQLAIAHPVQESDGPRARPPS